jgi:hypothetical protein
MVVLRLAVVASCQSTAANVPVHRSDTAKVLQRLALVGVNNHLEGDKSTTF